MAKGERVTVESGTNDERMLFLDGVGFFMFFDCNTDSANRIAARLSAAFEKTEADERERCQQILDKGPVDEPQMDNTGEWQTGLHCGLEDRGIGDRYEACDHGFECGVERALEWARNALAEVPNDG